MKECPKCHTRYDDTMNFCTKDGSQLMDLVPEEANPTSPEEKAIETATGGTSGAMKRKGRWKRTLLIVIIVLIVCCVGVYNYVMNASTYFDVEPKEITVPKYGSFYEGPKPTVDVLFDGYVWKVNDCPSWVDVDIGHIFPIFGYSNNPFKHYSDKRSFDMLFEVNHTGEDREGTIRLQSGKHTVDIVIHQKGK